MKSPVQVCQPKTDGLTTEPHYQTLCKYSDLLVLTTQKNI